MAAWPPGGVQTQQGVLEDSKDRPVACGEGCCEGHLVMCSGQDANRQMNTSQLHHAKGQSGKGRLRTLKIRPLPIYMQGISS